MPTTALDRALQLIADGTLSVTASGEIWRHRAETRGGANTRLPRRAESIGGKGYLRLMLWIDGELRGVGAHRVVWTHVNGAIPSDKQINHRNLIKSDNRPENLELATAAENIQHSYANGRRSPWSEATTWRTGRQRLTPAQIETARLMRASGAKLADIAAKLGIAVSHAHRITAG